VISVQDHPGDFSGVPTENSVLQDNLCGTFFASKDSPVHHWSNPRKKKKNLLITRRIFEQAHPMYNKKIALLAQPLNILS
jgi:hypothetical protein